MSFWSRIAKFLTGGAATENRTLAIYVMSHRCHEPVAGQVDLLSELSRTENDVGFYTRKVLHTTGETRCFDQVELELWFDSRKKLERYEVSGGRWLEAEEYRAELERFNAEPEEESDTAATSDAPNGEAASTGETIDTQDSQETNAG